LLTELVPVTQALSPVLLLLQQLLLALPVLPVLPQLLLVLPVLPVLPVQLVPPVL
jgi:hypothetical protein